MQEPAHQEEVKEAREILRSWGAENYQDYPWRRPGRAWHGLVAEILLQRTRAENVVPVYRVFVETFPTPADLARASEDQVQLIIYPLGLRWRAPLLVSLGKELTRLGKVPDTFDELVVLPGIGPYVAAAWLSFHADGRGVLIDANIVRWICRMTGREYDGETRRKRWLRDFMEQLTPLAPVKEFNYALLDFTMLVCTPVNPKCSECPFADRSLCEFGKSRRTPAP